MLLHSTSSLTLIHSSHSYLYPAWPTSNHSSSEFLDIRRTHALLRVAYSHHTGRFPTLDQSGQPISNANPSAVQDRSPPLPCNLDAQRWRSPREDTSFSIAETVISALDTVDLDNLSVSSPARTPVPTAVAMMGEMRLGSREPVPRPKLRDRMQRPKPKPTPYSRPADCHRPCESQPPPYPGVDLRRRIGPRPLESRLSDAYRPMRRRTALIGPLPGVSKRELTALLLRRVGGVESVRKRDGVAEVVFALAGAERARRLRELGGRGS